VCFLFMVADDQKSIPAPAWMVDVPSNWRELKRQSMCECAFVWEWRPTKNPKAIKRGDVCTIQTSPADTATFYYQGFWHLTVRDSQAAFVPLYHLCCANGLAQQRML
jgi:hypothetical protein